MINLLDYSTSTAEVNRFMKIYVCINSLPGIIAVTMTARQRVLEYIRKQRIASAEQIGHGLNMSAATVRHHLSILLADGRVIMTGGRHKESRGRPVKLYGLSEKSIGDNFPLLAAAVLEELLKTHSSAKRSETIDAVARKLALRFEGDDLSDLPAAKRLAIVVEKLNEMHYQARWEAGAQGPRFLFAHCPYAAIIERHPELCRMDETLLAVGAGAGTHQLAKIGASPPGSPYCVFQIG